MPSFGEVERLARQTNSYAHIKVQNQFVLLTAENYDSQVLKASLNFARLRRNDTGSFVLRIYLRMNLLKKQVAIAKVEQPTPALECELSFSFSESRLADFLQALNLI